MSGFTHAIIFFINRKMHITLLHTTSYCILTFFWVPILTNPILNHEERSMVLIQRASNLSHCLKSWKNIWPRGLFNTIFSIYLHLPGLFSPSKKWVMTAVKEMGFVTEILSPSNSLFTSFICKILLVMWLLTHKCIHVTSLEHTIPVHGPDIKQFD